MKQTNEKIRKKIKDLEKQNEDLKNALNKEESSFMHKVGNVFRKIDIK